MLATETLTKLANCRKGDHDLERVYSSKYECFDGETVVRWCKVCGSVVVDVDVDRRINAGYVRPMRRPLLFELAKQAGQ